MQTTTVRINLDTWKVLKDLAAQAGESMQEVLHKAVEDYRRRRFLEEANRAYAALREDADAWQAELRERAVWDGVLGDGLEGR